MVDENRGSLLYMENQSLDHGWDLRRSISQSNERPQIDKDKRVQETLSFIMCLK